MSEPAKKPNQSPESYSPKKKPEILKLAEEMQNMSIEQQQTNVTSGGEPPKTLPGVPKVYYGAFGGITPFPICLKAVSDYLGDELDYTYAIVACGGAFRFAWDTTDWNGGNVDIAHAYSDMATPYRLGIKALGREFKMLWREDNPWGVPGNATKEDVKTFVCEQIDMGRPVISLGPIGPAEAGILTGYRDGGDALLGWSLFQHDGTETFGEEGYFITDKYWDEGDFVAVMSLGDITGPRFDTKVILRNAIAALEGRQDGKYAKGTAAYDAWKKALLAAEEKDFEPLPDWGQSIAMMCQGDATDCLIDGRKNACKYFRALAEANPEQPLYGEIAEQFGIIAATIHEKVFKALGGYERGKKQNKALMKLKTRQKIAAYIDVMKAADEKALALMKELLVTI
ncbi:MAG: RNA polymerase subunit sigma-24 [Oscillospiraceae bacterium]|nr:RNA polymerase subunit sigma-24 [Oscillospiraceae bacterium]